MSTDRARLFITPRNVLANWTRVWTNWPKKKQVEDEEEDFLFKPTTNPKLK